ncbi:hypothetical protein BJY52DRAFT_1194791 [Lactarius psammicola]|nr:hypothetical protein BJY52DRAFT_1194791 [Lactarius psammicola]
MGVFLLEEAPPIASEGWSQVAQELLSRHEWWASFGLALARVRVLEPNPLDLPKLGGAEQGRLRSRSPLHGRPRAAPTAAHAVRGGPWDVL